MSNDFNQSTLIGRPSIPWTPVSEYVEKVMKRSEERGWGFTQTDAEKLAASLHDHFGDLYPTGVSIWLGKDLRFNWSELMLWIKDEVGALGYEFYAYIKAHDNELVFFQGGDEWSTDFHGWGVTGELFIDVVDLDLQTFWKPKYGVAIRKERLKHKKWPGLEVAALLALNPQVFIMMDGIVVPQMVSAGLIWNYAGIPYFLCHNNRIYISGVMDATTGWFATMVAYRKC